MALTIVCAAIVIAAVAALVIDLIAGAVAQTTTDGASRSWYHP